MPDAPSGKLDGWKAIASYLSRDERTAQRWARERGMPVHHVPGGRSGTVFAFRQELGAWLASPVPGHSDSTPADGHDGPIRPELVIPPAPTAARLSEPRTRRLGLAVIGTVAVLAIGAAIALLRVGTLAAPDIRTVELAGTSLIARDPNGETVWTYALRATTAGESGQVASGMQPQLAREPAFMDFESDGRREVLVFLRSRPAGGTVGNQLGSIADNLLCLTARGDLVWTFTPAAVLTFAGRRFDGPWRIGPWVGPESSFTGHVWLAVIHHTWWPSYLVSIDAAGNHALRYVSSGHIYALASMHREATTVILAAGVNNEYAAASLAVLDEEGPAAASPQTSSSSYWCDNCPTGRPLRYFVFPRSELNELSTEPYNRAQEIIVTSNYVEISVFERSEEHAELRSIYRLSRTLDVESVSMSDAYWEAHRRLGREGKISHTVQQCKEYSEGKEVRVWTPTSGWTTSWARPEERQRRQPQDNETQ